MIKSVVNIGVSGFPYQKSAHVYKCLFINKILLEAGFQIIVINNEAALTGEKNENYHLSGEFEMVPFHTTLNTLYEPDSWIKKRLLRLIGFLNECLFLFSYNNKVGIDAAILLTNGSFPRLLIYRFLSLILRFKLILIYHEFRSDFEFRKKQLRFRFNDILFDKYFPFLVDAVMPISEFLIKHVNDISKSKPILKVPPLVDYQLFYQTNNNAEPYFLYCGSASFVEAIDFIIKAFENTSNKGAFQLYLIINGNYKQLKKINEKIESSSKKAFIKVFTDVEFKDLLLLYQNAKALLIPLKPDVRDAARFPQKIAEYCASGNPIISTNFGEVKHYFKDGQSALIAKDYEEIMYAQKMDFVILNPEKAKEIGLSGKLIGFENFHYKNYIEKMRSFLHNLS
jgi:glycosyltransferase involved in cell wall biosynthesis